MRQKTATYELIDEETGEVLFSARFKPMPAHRAAEAAHESALIVQTAEQHGKELQQFIEEHAESEEFEIVAKAEVMLATVHKSVNGGYGYLLSKVLAEPIIEPLEGGGMPVVRGLHVYDQLWELGWSHAAIVALYRAAAKYVQMLKTGATNPADPDLAKVREVLDFGGTPTAQGSQTTS